MFLQSHKTQIHKNDVKMQFPQDTFLSQVPKTLILEIGSYRVNKPKPKMIFNIQELPKTTINIVEMKLAQIMTVPLAQITTIILAQTVTIKTPKIGPDNNLTVCIYVYMYVL